MEEKLTKVFFKLLLCIVVNFVAYMIANAVLPHSQGLTELNSSINPMSMMMFLLLKCTWLCFTMFFIIKNTCFGGKKLILNLILIIFFITSFTQHIDTLFIVSAFPVMTKLDIISTILSGLFSILVTAPLLVYFFQNNGNVVENIKLNLKSLVIKLGIIGIIYLILYLFFGFFVIIRIDEFKQFYSSLEVNPAMLILFQILRGILLGIFVLPIKNMVKTKKIFIICIYFVYLCMAVDLIIPNTLLPTNLRRAHLIEMTISMIIFGTIVGNIMWGKQKTSA